MESEEDLLARVKIAADVGLSGIDDHVYENRDVDTVYVLKSLVVTSSLSCKWTRKRNDVQ